MPPAGPPYAFPFGSHVAVAEVDTETGKVALVRHVTVDDAGTVLNPVLAEGQRHGGIARGVAQALLEEVVFDADARGSGRRSEDPPVKVTMTVDGGVCTAEVADRTHQAVVMPLKPGPGATPVRAGSLR